MNGVIFKQYCQKFIDHTLKYADKENKQIQLEYIAYKNGIISKQNFDNLKSARQNTILIFNSIAYKFSNIKCNNLYDYSQLYELLKTLINSCSMAVNE